MSEASVGPVGAMIPVPNDKWTTDLLYVYFAAKVEELKDHLGDLRTADAKAIDAALAAAKEAVAAALAASKEATNKYEAQVELWRAANNEWRATLTEREVKFLLIDTFVARAQGWDVALSELRTSRDQSIGLAATVNAHAKEIDELQEFKNKLVGKQQAQLFIIAGVFAVITIVLRFIPLG